MKIGILTYHRSINYGAVMQCYTLATELKRRFPDDLIEVIDYVPKFRYENYKPSLLHYILPKTSLTCSFLHKMKIVGRGAVKLLLNGNEYKAIRKKYDAFQKSMSCLPLSQKALISDSEKDFQQQYAGDYDVIIVGSDCVWEWTTVPFPNAYYLCGEFNAVKVSYAASLGTDNIDCVPIEKRAEIAEAIRDFSYIGVRDLSTEFVVKELLPNGTWFHNCDPTTFLSAGLLDEHRLKMKERLEQAGIKNDKPIIGVMGSKKIFHLARRIFGDNAYYVGLYYYHKKCDLNLFDISVLEWASVFGLFDMTVTTFFHGTMLSLVNGTPVFSIDYLPENQNQKTKLRELYQRLDLPGFYYRDKHEYTDEDIKEMQQRAEQFIHHPPKHKIAVELAKEAKSSESFFEKIREIKLNLNQE